ncbi:MAG: FlgD immunoglobulin-like domain containing protein, partial [bacterium]
PFNPATKLRFRLSRAAPADLRIFDVRGKLVAILVREHLAAGLYEVKWSGRDDRGKKVPSGVYLALLVAGKQNNQVKLLLLK